MATPDEPDPGNCSGSIVIRGPRLLLRALRPEEIEAEWQAVVDADPIAIATLPDEDSFEDRLRREDTFKARLRRSGTLRDGWLDLAIDVGGESIGRIQTFVPPGRALDPGVYMVGIGLRARSRGSGYGREALVLLTGWLFASAAAERVEAQTDPANLAMRAVFGHAGWQLAGTSTESGRVWMMYAVTRQQWKASQPPEPPPAAASGGSPAASGESPAAG
jgi:RimJ/RimL family protein N-acetyltransferase